MLSAPLAFLNFADPVLLIILGVVGILVFGRKLPEIGRNLGKSIVEFKKGLNDAGQENHKSVEEGSDKPSKTLYAENMDNKKVPSTTPPRSIKQIASTTDEP